MNAGSRRHETATSSWQETEPGLHSPEYDLTLQFTPAEIVILLFVNYCKTLEQSPNKLSDICLVQEFYY